MKSRLSRFATVATVAAVCLLFVASTANADRRRRPDWNRYVAALLCSSGNNTQVLVHNSSKKDVNVMVSTVDVNGDTQNVDVVPAEGLKGFDCASTGQTGPGVLSLQSQSGLDVTAVYTTTGGQLEVLPIPASRERGRKMDDSDDGDSDDSQGTPTPAF